MPTISEIFHSIVERRIQACSGQCWCCEGGDPGKCWKCVFTLPDDVCDNCSGTGVCEVCNGTGIFTIKEYDLDVIGYVSMSMIRIMHSAREEGDFDTMNQFLDITEEWVVRMQHANIKSMTQEEIENRLRDYTDSLSNYSPKRAPKVKLSGNKLSSEELKKLGISDKLNEEKV